MVKIIVAAPLNSGSSISFARSSVLPLDHGPTGKLRVVYVHRDMREGSTVAVSLGHHSSRHDRVWEQRHDAAVVATSCPMPQLLSSLRTTTLPHSGVVLNRDESNWSADTASSTHRSLPPFVKQRIPPPTLEQKMSFLNSLILFCVCNNRWVGRENKMRMTI